jgi:hypothetical protein
MCSNRPKLGAVAFMHKTNPAQEHTVNNGVQPAHGTSDLKGQSMVLCQMCQAPGWLVQVSVQHAQL